MSVKSGRTQPLSKEKLKTAAEITNLLTNQNYALTDACLLTTLPVHENESKEWAKQYSEPTGTANAHLYSTVQAALSHLQRESKDQSVILVGQGQESLFGVARHLCDLTKTTSKKTRIHSGVLRANAVLDAFLCTKAHRYVEYQFDVVGRMVGAKYVVFGIDYSKTEKVFEYMVSGMDAVEKTALQLEGGKLSKAGEFKTLCENLKALGISSQSSLWQRCAAIHHLNSVQFVASAELNEACRVKNTHVLVLAADLLGVTADTLEGLLVSRRKTINNDLISEYLGKSLLIQILPLLSYSAMQLFARCMPLSFKTSSLNSTNGCAATILNSKTLFWSTPVHPLAPCTTTTPTYPCSICCSKSLQMTLQPASGWTRDLAWSSASLLPSAKPYPYSLSPLPEASPFTLATLSTTPCPYNPQSI